MWLFRLLVLAWLLVATVAHAGTVRLAWDLNAYTAANAVGIKVYFGTAPGVYGAPILIPVGSSYTLTGIGAGTWYVAVTAYDGSTETVISNEVAAVVPAGVTGFRQP